MHGCTRGQRNGFTGTDTNGGFQLLDHWTWPRSLKAIGNKGICGVGKTYIRWQWFDACLPSNLPARVAGRYTDTSLTSFSTAC